MDHPADLKIRVWGKTATDLFINSGRALMALLFEEKSIQLSPSRSETITISADTRDSLLINWLSELLYRANTYHREYVQFHIRKLTPTLLTANIGSVRGNAIEDIKAVTYHELVIKRQGRRWQATMVFDV